MARKYITGVKELEATLKSLAEKEADKIAKSAISAGLTVLSKAIKKAAPVGKTGALKASIGRRLERKKRSGAVIAKAGINVGKQSKKKPPGVRAPHSHLVGLGTGPRVRSSINGPVSTGTMPSNPFVRNAAAASRSAVVAAMQRQAAKAMARAAAKAKKTRSK